MAVAKLYDSCHYASEAITVELLQFFLTRITGRGS